MRTILRRYFFGYNHKLHIIDMTMLQAIACMQHFDICKFYAVFICVACYIATHNVLPCCGYKLGVVRTIQTPPSIKITFKPN